MGCDKNQKELELACLRFRYRSRFRFRGGHPIKGDHPGSKTLLETGEVARLDKRNSQLSFREF